MNCDLRLMTCDLRLFFGRMVNSEISDFAPSVLNCYRNTNKTRLIYMIWLNFEVAFGFVTYDL